MTITELGRMGVKPSLDIMNPSTPEGQILSKCYSAIATAKNAPYTVFIGLEIEDPLKIWGFFDWESLEHHQEFAKTFGGEAVKDLPLILTHGEFTKHIQPTPTLNLALSSPVTEVLILYFPSTISPEQKSKATAALEQFVQKGFNTCPDVKAVSYGWGVEDDFPIRDNENGEKGIVLMAFVGWESVEKHEEFKETEAFKENVGVIGGIEGVVKMAGFHLKCKSFKDVE